MWDVFAFIGIGATAFITIIAAIIGLLYLWAKAMGMPD